MMSLDNALDSGSGELHYLGLVEIMNLFIKDLDEVLSELGEPNWTEEEQDSARRRIEALRATSYARTAELAEVVSKGLGCGVPDDHLFDDVLRVLFRFLQAQMDVRTDVFVRYWNAVRSDTSVDVSEHLLKQARQISLLASYLDNLKMYGATTTAKGNAADATTASEVPSLAVA